MRGDAPDADEAGALPAPARLSLARLALPRYISIRTILVFLLLIALLPLGLLAVGQGLAGLKRQELEAERRLAEQVLLAASSEQSLMTASESILRLLMLNRDVRQASPACEPLLASLDSAYPLYRNLLRASPDGRVLCASTPLAMAPVVPRGDAAGLVVAPPAPGGARLAWTLLPLGGDSPGFVALAIDLAHYERMLRQRYAGRAGTVLLLDGAGHVLAASRPTAPGPLQVDRPPGGIVRMVDPGSVGWSYATVPLVVDRQGKVLLRIAHAMPARGLRSVQDWFSLGYFLLPLLALLATSLAVWFGANWAVLRWVGALGEMADAYGRGDYRARGANFRDAPLEIRELGSALYRMARSIEHRDARLRRMMHEQAALSREVHHRVKNNLQILVSQLTLQERRAASVGTQRELTRARVRVDGLALVHRLIYEGGELADVQADRLVAELCAQLRRAHPDAPAIELGCESDRLLLDIDTAVPVTMWLTEAVANAYEHAFDKAGGGRIRVWLRCTAREQVELVVEDDGLGFDTEARAAGYGIRLLRAVGRQLGSETRISPRSEGRGTRLALVFRPRRLSGT